MYGGNIGAAQDFDTVLAAAAATRHRRDIHWVLVGDGRARGQVEAEVKRQDLSATVHLTGPRPPADMPVLFALADALLLTLRREPAFAVTVPSKLQAYLACGRPILAGIDGEAARIVVEADAGLAVPAGDPAALAAAAITMADAPPGVREAWGRNGAGYFEREFGRATTLERLLDGLSGSREPGRT
jgi:glycosyltransferase involved in cell wall biosynthesis